MEEVVFHYANARVHVINGELDELCNEMDENITHVLSTYLTCTQVSDGAQYSDEFIDVVFGGSYPVHLEQKLSMFHVFLDRFYSKEEESEKMGFIATIGALVAMRERYRSIRALVQDKDDPDCFIGTILENGTRREVRVYPARDTAVLSDLCNDWRDMYSLLDDFLYGANNERMDARIKAKTKAMNEEEEDS